MTNLVNNILLIISSSDIITKIISLILFIKRFSDISKEINIKTSLPFNYYDDSLKRKHSSKNWSKTSIFKFIINIILTILSFSIVIVCLVFIFLKLYYYNDYSLDNLLILIIVSGYYLFESIIWLLSSILYYKETKYYRNQSWNGLRFFWFTNGLYTFIKIANLSLIIAEENQINYYGFYILIIQFLFSLILLYFAICKPYDFKYSNIEEIFEDHLLNNKNENEYNSELNSIGNDDSILDYTDNFDNAETFKDDLLYTIYIKNNLNNNEKPTKINFYIKIKTSDFIILTFIIKTKNNKYIKKKSPTEFSNFLKKLIKVYKLKKYENSIINISQQSYNISLTINPKRNSYTGKKDSIITLTHLCNEGVKISNNFLLDLLLFLDLSDIDLVTLLKKNYIESAFEEDNFEEADEDISNINNNISTIQKKQFSYSNILNFTESNNSQLGDKKLLLNNIHQMSRDMIKLYIFFNNILIKENFISIKIVKYNEESNEIECLLKTINPYKEASIKINSENLIDIIYDDELKTYYIDNINSMNENNDYSIFEILLNDYLNNLIYYDDNLFKIFQLNKILNLDIEKFDENVLINFFEYDNIECENNIGNILLEVNISPLTKENFNNNNLFSVKYTLKAVDQKNIINENNKKVDMDLYLLQLYIVIDSILPIINSYLQKNFNELYSALSEIKTYIENYIEISLDIDAEGIKKIKNKCGDEINKIKYQKLKFGEQKIDKYASLMENMLTEKNKGDIDSLKNNIEKLNGPIKEINRALNRILNNKSLKYVLFFSFMRKILGIFKLF